MYFVCHQIFPLLKTSILDPHWFQCGSGSRDLMTQIFKILFVETENSDVFDKKMFTKFIPKPQIRTSKLQEEKPPVLKRISNITKYET
jgi:hypothetical protein